MKIKITLILFTIFSSSLFTFNPTCKLKKWYEINFAHCESKIFKIINYNLLPQYNYQKHFGVNLANLNGSWFAKIGIDVSINTHFCDYLVTRLMENLDEKIIAFINEISTLKKLMAANGEIWQRHRVQGV